MNRQMEEMHRVGVWEGHATLQEMPWVHQSRGSLNPILLSFCGELITQTSQVFCFVSGKQQRLETDICLFWQLI